jgi:hypothetical protein
MAAKQQPVKLTAVLLPVASFALECRLKINLPSLTEATVTQNRARATGFL